MYAKNVRVLQSFAAAATVLLAVLGGGAAFAQTSAGSVTRNVTKGTRITPDQVVADVRIDQKLNSQLPLDTVFQDDGGRTVTLRDAIGNKPAVLVMLQYRCPMLCGLMMEGLNRALTQMKFSVGKEYNVVVVSIDPAEGQREALIKKQEYVQLYERAGAGPGFRFLTGTGPNIARVADAAGFRFKHDEQTGAYVHASGIMVVTPQGKMARYFFGIEYPARILRLSLVEAGEGKIGTLADKMTLFCYMYDPIQGKYGLAISRITQALGILTVLVLGAYMLVQFRRDRNRRLVRVAAPSAAGKA